MSDGMADKKRRAGVGAAWSQSESAVSRRVRRVERGERAWCCGETGEDGGERAKLAARTIDGLLDAVGVTARLVRGAGCSW